MLTTLDRADILNVLRELGRVTLRSHPVKGIVTQHQTGTWYHYAEGYTEEEIRALMDMSGMECLC